MGPQKHRLIAHISMNWRGRPLLRAASFASDSAVHICQSLPHEALNAVSVISGMLMTVSRSETWVLRRPGNLYRKTRTQPSEATKMTRSTSQIGLDRLHEAMASRVAKGELPGMVTLVAQAEDVHVDAIGVMAFGGDQPMRRDTIFRIASMTKPILATATMMLVEEGKLAL